MSVGGGRKVTPEEIERVKDSIERCILNYMKKKEVVDFLYQQQNIEPCFTRIVWQRLEEQNKQFFRNYYLRLAVKDQITRFNDLLEKQAEIMKQMNANGVYAFPPMQPIAFDLPQNGLNNTNGSLGFQSNHFDHPLSLAHNPNGGMIEEAVNNESGDLGNSGSVSSSSNMESNSHQVERTFRADLSALMSSYPDTLFDHSNANNQGQNIDFQNSGFVEMSQGLTTSRTRQVANGSLYDWQLECGVDIDSI